MPLGKLKSTSRIIGIYKKAEGDILCEQVDEIKVDTIPLEVLKNIVKPNEDDPLLYDGYPLEPEQLVKLNELIENKIIPNYSLFEYTLECYGEYE